MSKPRFFKNPEYCEYVRLLVRLHDLISGGEDEGPIGERLRDQMDVCSVGFSDEEVATLGGLSGDLCSIADRGLASTPSPATPQAQHEIPAAMQAMESGEYTDALTLLRRNRAMIGPSKLSYFRGRILEKAGLHDVATRFFEHASQLEPDNDNYKVLALDTLKRFDVARARVRANAILAGWENHPSRLVLKAVEIRFESTRELSLNEAALIERQLIPIFENIIEKFETGSDGGGGPVWLSLAYSLCGLCYQDIDEIDDARHCFDQALRLDRNNEGVLTARGILLYGQKSTNAISDFLEAVARNASTVWPFLFLGLSGFFGWSLYKLTRP